MVLPPTVDLYIKMASAVGTVIGQITFGILIDLYGRKKVVLSLTTLMHRCTVLN